MHSNITPDCSTPLSTAGSQTAGAEDRVDGAHVVAVAALDRAPALHVDAERRAVERLLDVVHGERVAREQHVHVAVADQIAEVGAAAGVDDDGAGDERDAFARLLGRAHHRGDARHAHLDAALGRDLVRHEREAEPIARLELRHDLDPVDAADDRVAVAELAQLPADGAAVLDDDRRVHALAIDRHPLAVEAHGRLMVRRRVEVLRRAAVAIGRHDVRVLGARDAASERHQLLEHLGQRGGGLRGDAHRHERRLVVGAADPELEDVERRVVADDGVEHRVHELGVDEVAFGLDDLCDGGRDGVIPCLSASSRRAMMLTPTA